MNDRFLEDLKDRIDIRDVVNRYTSLKKSGKNYMGKSPFRNEKTPSFCVSPDRNLWYDFGASEGGDLIRFIEKIENCSFHEAVEHLSQIAGVEIPRNFGEKPESKQQKNDLYTLHKSAAEFFATQLQQSKKATDYLKKRGFSVETIAQWQLGYGGDDSNGLTKHLLQKGFSQNLIAESGVAFERQFGDKSMRDRFYGRIMIPIREPKNGKIIAFSGREIHGKKDIAKYINSPENPVYHKSSTLFGLDKARKNIRDQEKIILVEGNFDVISAHQSGFDTTVATCGTALTDEHLRMVKRLTSNIFLAFDTDIAGKKATLKSVEMILKLKLSPFIIDLTGAKDIDEFLQSNPEELKSRVKSAQPALEFLFERFAQKCLNGNVAGETKFLDSFFYFLRLIDRPIEVDDFLEKIARKIGRRKDIVEKEFQQFRSKKISYQKPKFVAPTKIQFSLEENFVGFCSAFIKFLRPSLTFEYVEILSAEKKPRKIFSVLFEGQPLDPEDQIQLSAWQMYQENMYGEDLSESRALEELANYKQKLEREAVKRDRIKAAQSIQL